MYLKAVVGGIYTAVFCRSSKCCFLWVLHGRPGGSGSGRPEHKQKARGEAPGAFFY